MVPFDVVTGGNRMLSNKGGLHHVHSDAITRRLKSCVNKFYGFVNLRVIFQNTRRIKSFFPYKDRFNRSQKSKIVYKASCRNMMLFTSAKLKEDYVIERRSA